MKETVPNEEVENDDGHVGFKVSFGQLGSNLLDRPQVETFRLAVRVDGDEVEGQGQVETKLPGGEKGWIMEIRMQ